MVHEDKHLAMFLFSLEYGGYSFLQCKVDRKQLVDVETFVNQRVHPVFFE